MTPNLRSVPIPSTSDLDALMNGRQVSAFFGSVSKMTLFRWAQNPASGFPLPFKIGQKNYWIRRDIISFRDMQRARAQGGDPQVGARRAKKSVSTGDRSPGSHIDAGSTRAQVPKRETQSPGSEL
jgi:hypothetical protein